MLKRNPMPGSPSEIMAQIAPATSDLIPVVPVAAMAAAGQMPPRAAQTNVYIRCSETMAKTLNDLAMNTGSLRVAIAQMLQEKGHAVDPSDLRPGGAKRYRQF